MALTDAMHAKQQILAIQPFGYRKIGQKVFGQIEPFTITESGLSAAAHRAGQTAVKEFIQHLSDHGWVSDPATFPPDPKVRARFNEIETRLRKFADLPYWRSGHPR